MFILENTPLSTLSTMRLGGNAAYMTEVNDRQDIAKSYAWAEERSLPVMVVGQGSNIIWSDNGFAGLILVNKIKGFEIFEEDDENIYVTVGSGEVWDQVVEQTVQKGFSGLEQLSLVPGTAGATPVQNVGAYGREIAEVLTTVEAYDTIDKKFVTIPASDCEFGYRTSRFKSSDKSRFIISSITFHLTKTYAKPPFYGSIETYLKEHNLADFSPHNIREAVIAIRTSKLPDPAKVANVGSFFHNPIVDQEVAAQLLKENDGMPHWDVGSEKVKLSAAWLIEKAGFKDFHDTETGMGTWPSQPLVFVNENAHSTADLLRFREKVTSKVRQKFGIDLNQEPELVTGGKI